MAARRRSKHHKPLIPGFWLMVAVFLLVASIFGFYAGLGHFTTFQRLDPAPESPPAKAP